MIETNIQSPCQRGDVPQFWHTQHNSEINTQHVRGDLCKKYTIVTCEQKIKTPGF